MQALRGELTYANVISTLCLFMLLGGGAYAATELPKNSVGAKQIKNGAITGKEIKKKTITASKLTPSAIASLKGPGALGAVGPQGPQGTTNGGSYATVVPPQVEGDPPTFLGSHPGFTAVERVPPESEEEAQEEEEFGVYCLTAAPGTSIEHPITSTNWADSGSKGVFVEPFARESNFSKCAEGKLEIRTYQFFAFEPGVPKPSNSVSFTVFVPIPTP
jgi:hypothetical protein